MLLTVAPDFDIRTPHLAPRASRRIVWQERYDGIAVVAYQGGRAIAGISGPWSNRYALTWWQPHMNAQLEIFDTLEAAKQAVEAQLDAPSVAPRAHVPALQPTRTSWLTRARRWLHRRHADVAALRSRSQRADADLSGLNFSATED